MIGRVREDRVLLALAVLLAAGLVLRVWLTAVWSPALIGYSDTGIYFTGAVESLWSDPIRMVGYSIFLRALHFAAPNLILVVVVQHAMGLLAAALAFFTVRRCGGPPWLGLAPAAVLALGGDVIFLEHAALSDALFIFLIAAMLYCAVRTLDDGLPWAALAGLCAGFAVWDRTAGLGLVIVLAIWLALAWGRPSRRSLSAAGAALGVALVVVGIYAGWRSAAADLPGALTSNNAWNLYGRVAPWADCEKFTPPPGSEGLCESTPAAERGYRSGEEYIYWETSPAHALYGPPYLLSGDPDAMEEMEAWSQAAIRGQPGDYLHAVWRDAIRLVDSDAASYSQLSADELIDFLLYGAEGPDGSGRNEFSEYWQGRLYPDEPPPRHGDIGPLRWWEEVTRVDGLLMIALLALSFGAPFLLRGRPRSGALLFAATAWLLLFFPILLKGFDYRFVIPAFAPLAAAAALSAWGLAGWVRGERPRSPRPPGDDRPIPASSA